MFRVETSNGKFDVRFKYKDVYLAKSKGSRAKVWMEFENILEAGEVDGENPTVKPVIDSVKTECVISRVLDDKVGRERYIPVAFGEVVRYPVDKFNKGKGRKEAFANAVEKLGADTLGDISNITSKKTARRTFWKAFMANIKCEKQYLKNIDPKAAFFAEFTKLPSAEVIKQNCATVESK